MGKDTICKILLGITVFLFLSSNAETATIFQQAGDCPFYRSLYVRGKSGGLGGAFIAVADDAGFR